MSELIDRFFRNITTSFIGFRFNDIIDILFVAVLVFLILELLVRNRTVHVIVGFFILAVILWTSDLLKLHTLNYFLRQFFSVGLLALVVIFQPEIRRFFDRVSGLKNLFSGEKRDDAEALIAQIVLACSEMSKNRVGALIIIERNHHLDEQTFTGTIVNADITAELIKNLFYPKAPLHDGAVIIRNWKILSAGCMLPMTNKTTLSKDLGMRHRAGIGMSENSDAVVIIVSEESGAISVATDGTLKRHLNPDTFDRILRSELLNDSAQGNYFDRVLSWFKARLNDEKN